jgi:hypothetical protein
MKRLCILALSIGVNLSNLFGATVMVQGELRTGSFPDDDTLISTLHFIQLEVLAPGLVSIEAAFVGGNAPFRLFPLAGVPYGPLRIDPDFPNQFGLYPWSQAPISSVTGIMPIGSYLISIQLSESEWIYDEEGFGPVGPQGDPGQWSMYRVTVSGDIRPIAMWRGQRDGTFKIQPLPEPSVAFAVVIGLGVLQRRRQKSLNP